MTNAVNVLKTTWSGGTAGSGRLMSTTLDTKIAIPLALKGSGEGAHPKELLVASAASCYVMTLAAMMDARKLPEADITVETTLTGTPDAGLRIAHDTHIVFAESASAEEIQRAEVLVESADSACMVGNLLRKGGVEVTVQGHVSA